jgi:hypothetical protein
LNPVWIANAITGSRGRDGLRVPDALTQSLTERSSAPPVLQGGPGRSLTIV